MKLRWKIAILVGVLLIVGLGYAGNYFYNYAVVPSEKDFLKGDTSGTDKSNANPEAEEWFTAPENRQMWQLESSDGLMLSGIYLPAQKSQHKTVIVAHGYMGNAETMGVYAKMFHDLGYNVLVPDARGHGESQGDYIGFGWPERKELCPMDRSNLKRKRQGKESIVLYGVSMGAATVMMTSGEKLPANVTAIIEDCGYASVNEELSYQLDQLFGLPAFPLINVTSLVTKLRAGYFFGEADAVKQLHKNTRPMFFIHGNSDTFVPYSMLAEVYAATDAPKEKWVVKGAEHAQSYTKDPKRYQEKIAAFLEKYDHLPE